jgi:hypothetical protein
MKYLVVHVHPDVTKFESVDTLEDVSAKMNAPEWVGWQSGYLQIETTDPGGSIDGLSARGRKSEAEPAKRRDSD